MKTAEITVDGGDVSINGRGVAGITDGIIDAPLHWDNQYVSGICPEVPLLKAKAPREIMPVCIW